ncbi:MAG TPA: MFS transporter [Nonomuraea sp.]|nr:MFS transporter [Nonomuraea sp.]
MSAPEPTLERSVDRRLVVLLAVGAGVSAANMYYAQPLLDRIADDLDVSAGTAGLLVTASQIGFAVGLATLVPLGDLVARHKLIGPVLGLCALFLLGAAASPAFPVLAVALLGVGLTATVAQMLVPLAGTLAADHDRGRVVGTVISGLLLGVLLARTVAGLLAAVAGWRTVFVAAAGVVLLLAVVLYRALPRLPALNPDLTYRTLLGSIGPLVREEPVLRRRMIYGALGMISFTIVWTSLSFLMAEDYGKGEAETGLLGLAGFVGALAAQGAGRLADRGWQHRSTGAFLACMLIGWVLLWFGGDSILALVLGLVILDWGIQGQNILSQTLIFALRAEARSRITTAYMTAIFVSGAIASAGSALAWSLGGWDAVSALGLGFAAIGMVLWLSEHWTLRNTKAADTTSTASAEISSGPDGI